MKKIETQDKACANCGASFNRSKTKTGRLEKLADYAIRKFCSHNCYVQHNVGQNHYNWGDGFRRGHDWGYLRFRDGKYVHRVVMEQKLGRPLDSDEHVHHIDGDVTNNDPNNLELTTNAEHRRKHAAGQVRNRKGEFCCAP